MPEIEGHAVDLEIWEDWPDGSYADPGAIVPRRVKINGVEVLTPAGKPIIELGHIDGRTTLVATLNVFVRSLVINGRLVDDA